ncbi:MAG: hypothetical protein NDJ89_08835 [Oligoflexia bacterium]|nr:hypothetical protein [Oligoflexia bacterium]
MRWLPVLFGFLALVFAAVFVADLSGFFNSTKNPVALVARAEGSTRRLPKDELVWDRALPGALLAAGDTISTGESSTARIAFHSGAELELEPASMVVLGAEKDELKLNFVSGGGKVRVSKSATKKVTVARGAPKPAQAKPVNRAAAKPRKSATEVVDPLRTTPVATQPEVTLADSGPGAHSSPDVNPLTSVPEVDPLIEVTESEEIKPFTAAAAPTQPEAVPVTEIAAVAGATATAAGQGGRGRAPASIASAPNATNPQEPAPASKPVVTPIRERSATAGTSANPLLAQKELVAISALPPAPGPQFPAAEAAVTAGDGTALRWKAPEASIARAEDPVTEYEITLRREGRSPSEAPSLTLRTAETTLPLKGVAPGKYLWSVRSVSRSGKLSPASSSRWLEVLSPKLLPKPKTVSVQVEIEKPRVLSVEVE